MTLYGSFYIFYTLISEKKAKEGKQTCEINILKRKNEQMQKELEQLLSKHTTMTEELLKKRKMEGQLLSEVDGLKVNTSSNKIMTNKVNLNY